MNILKLINKMKVLIMPLDSSYKNQEEYKF